MGILICAPKHTKRVSRTRKAFEVFLEERKEVPKRYTVHVMEEQPWGHIGVAQDLRLVRHQCEPQRCYSFKEKE
jgi:hypothetical protein